MEKSVLVSQFSTKSRNFHVFQMGALVRRVPTVLISTGTVTVPAMMVNRNNLDVAKLLTIGFTIVGLGVVRTIRVYSPVSTSGMKNTWHVRVI